MRRRHSRAAAVAAACLVFWAGCATAPRYTRAGSRAPRSSRGPAPARDGRHGAHQLTGSASYYGPGFHGKKTASGERFNMYALTAAHKTLPFGTRVRVKNLENGTSVVVRVNDRGPYKKGRIIDLSLGAARKIGLITSGVARVAIEVLRE